MTLEQVKGERSMEEIPENPLEHIHKRTTSLENKIESREGLDERQVEGLPSSPEKDTLRTRLENLKNVTEAKIEFADAATTTLLAMNSQEFLAGKPTIEGKALSGEEIEGVVDALGKVIEGAVKQQKEKVENNVDVLTNKSEPTQKRIDAGVEITETPLVRQALIKQAPFVKFLPEINELQKKMQSPDAKPEDVAIMLGRILLDLKTFGLGTFLLDYLRKKE
jgi:hypothetical protein